MAKETRELPVPARAFPPLSDWLKNENNIRRLQRILVDPVFVAACHHAQSFTELKVADLIGKTPCIDQVVIRKAAMHAGATELIETLRTFTLKNLQPDDLGAWEHILPDPNR